MALRTPQEVGPFDRLLSTGRFPALEPTTKRLLRLTRSATCQEALHADIFIQIWPADPFATRNQAPVGAFRRRSAGQTWKPGEWDCDGPAIRKVRDQSIVTYANRQRFQCTRPASVHGDYYFSPSVALFPISDRLGEFAQAITAVDRRRDSAGLHEIAQDGQVLIVGARDERDGLAGAHEHRQHQRFEQTVQRSEPAAVGGSDHDEFPLGI